jgi:hypothetical protein
MDTGILKDVSQDEHDSIYCKVVTIGTATDILDSALHETFKILKSKLNLTIKKYPESPQSSPVYQMYQGSIADAEPVHLGTVEFIKIRADVTEARLVFCGGNNRWESFETIINYWQDMYKVVYPSISGNVEYPTDDTADAFSAYDAMVEQLCIQWVSRDQVRAKGYDMIQFLSENNAPAHISRKVLYRYMRNVAYPQGLIGKCGRHYILMKKN